MLKKLAFISAIVLMLSLVVGIGNTFAQGGGQGNGNGNDDRRGNGQFVHGGAGIVNEDGTPYQRGQGRNRETGFGIYSIMPPASDVPLTDELVALMTDGIMDEYNAYAIYESIITEFGEVRPFTNIQAAEQQHIDAWTFLFERYGLDVPAAPESVEVPTFATLADACQAAADAEIANFGLYDTMFDVFAGYPDIQQVVTSLRNASEYNHLPAFEACA